MDPAAGGVLTRDLASTFAPPSRPRRGAAVRRAGSRGQQNPPFRPRRVGAAGGRGRGALGAGGGCALRLSHQRGSAVTHSLGPLPPRLSPCHPPAASQQGQSVLTLAAASADPNLNRGGGKLRGGASPSPCLPSGGFLETPPGLALDLIDPSASF